MGKEIERKFLLNHRSWNLLEKPMGELYRQGYLLIDPDKTIRVRITPEASFLTIKARNVGASRTEYEYQIPETDANELLENFSQAELSKVRYKILYQGKIWEIDVFQGKNNGLILAEIELESEEEAFEIPNWIGEEVTGDEKYYNANLVLRPYQSW